MKKILVVLGIVFILISAASARVIYKGLHPKHIALTFDDGPSPGITDKILKILKNQNVKVTFFPIGRKIAKNPNLLKEIAADGHEIGNHTYFHSRLTQINDEEMLNEIRMASMLISKNTNTKECFFRPPYGKLTYSKRKLIEKAGYDIVYWSVSADDCYRLGIGMRGPDSITRKVISEVRGGDIVLMHDNSKEIVEALPKIIEALKKRGYYFVTVSQMLKYRQ